jgi:hypothetical protein
VRGGGAAGHPRLSILSQLLLFEAGVCAQISLLNPTFNSFSVASTNTCACVALLQIIFQFFLSCFTDINALVQRTPWMKPTFNSFSVASGH